MKRSKNLLREVYRKGFILVLGIFLTLEIVPTPLAAQTHTVTVAPGDVFTVTYPSEYLQSNTLVAAWLGQQLAVAAMSNSNYTESASNPNPGTNPTFFNGVSSLYYFDVTTCYTHPAQCTTTPDATSFSTDTFCPDNWARQVLFTANNNETIICSTTYTLKPNPKFCASCFGNPIFAGTGDKLQVETDYSGIQGLDFTRTYFSSNGHFASVLTQGFVDESVPNTETYCYPSHFTYSNYKSNYCFPYMSGYPYVNNGALQYLVNTEGGRSILFTGPAGSISENADIDERLLQTTVNGNEEWQVHRSNDTLEMYNESGTLISKTLRGGRAFTYTYSTSTTPASVAPQPGLLLTQSDAFGHTLTWQYNSSGQMSQMADPAGGTYSYSYDSNGNLSGITYPDNSTKAYWYNEPANMNGVDDPTALTGITDENTVRYATFQYANFGGFLFPLAVNTQHAGGVESYTFSNYSSNQATPTTVVDPLGTSRTYSFQNGASYNLDTGQTQPAASGSGTVTQSETYDGNGNVKQITDRNGGVTQYVYDLTRNLETSRTEAYGTSLARTITTQWNAAWRQPELPPFPRTPT